MEILEEGDYITDWLLLSDVDIYDCIKITKQQISKFDNINFHIHYIYKDKVVCNIKHIQKHLKTMLLQIQDNINIRDLCIQLEHLFTYNLSDVFTFGYEDVFNYLLKIERDCQSDEIYCRLFYCVLEPL